MATKIRLRRTGTTNLALYRIVVADTRSPRDGRFIETLGNYDPRKEGNDKITVNMERVNYWIGVGAQLTESVKTLLKGHGLELPQKNKRKKRAIKTQNTVITPKVETTEQTVEPAVEPDTTGNE